MPRRHEILGGLAVCVFVTISGYVSARGGFELTPREGEAGAPRPTAPDALHTSILAYVQERNPQAHHARFRDYPALVVTESARTGIDHCLALAQAQAESDFRHDAIGAAGEIGLYQVMPATAAIMEPVVGRFRRPVPAKKGGYHDLGDLADPSTNTRIAMAYLRDILVRRSTLRAALTEYNAGPRGQHPHYYRTVMATYVELLERPELQCRFRATPPAPRPPLTLVRVAATP